MEYLWVAKMEFDRIGGGLGYIYIYVNVRSLEMKRNLVHLFKDWRTQLTLFRRMETYSMLFLVWQMLSGELTPFTNCRPWRKTVDQGNHYLCILYVLKGHDKTAVITSFFSSPELKAQVSFSDHLSSVVCLSVRPSVCLSVCL